MKKTLNLLKSALLLLSISFTLIGCSNEPVLDFQQKDLNSNNNELSARNGTQFRFNASLNGGNEVPAIETHAVGQAIVTISKDETKIHYKLIVANIENVRASHFHMAPAGSNGGVVAFLFGPSQEPGPVNGVLAEGYIMANNVIGSIAGDLNALIAAIRNGNVYVNVHTSTYPGGEIRGQL